MENQKRTLEQVIIEAGRAFWTDNGNAGFGMSEGEMRRIAAAVREWVREQNEGLREEVEEAIIESRVAGFSDTELRRLSDAILSVIPPREPDDTKDTLLGLMRWANKRIEILERENAELSKRFPDPVTLQTEMEKWQASRIKTLEYQLDQEVWQHAACLTIAETGEKWGPDVIPSAAMQAVYNLVQRVQTQKRIGELEQQLKVNPEDASRAEAHWEEGLDPWGDRAQERRNKRIELLEAELAQERRRLDMSGIEGWNAIAEKAAKYDALREKFPFLPGEEFWFCNGDRITKRKVDEIDETHVLSGEYGLYQSECHLTAEACRNAIKVEE